MESLLGTTSVVPSLTTTTRIYKQEVFRCGWNIDWVGSRFFLHCAAKFLLGHRVAPCDTWLLIMSKLATALDVNCPLEANLDKNHASSRENASVLMIKFFEKKIMFFLCQCFFSQHLPSKYWFLNRIIIVAGHRRIRRQISWLESPPLYHCH